MAKISAEVVAHSFQIRKKKGREESEAVEEREKNEEKSHMKKGKIGSDLIPFAIST